MYMITCVRIHLRMYVCMGLGLHIMCVCVCVWSVRLLICLFVVFALVVSLCIHVCLQAHARARMRLHVGRNSRETSFCKRHPFMKTASARFHMYVPAGSGGAGT